METALEKPVKIPVGEVSLEGSLIVPPGAKSVVVFAHGSGSSRFSPRNRFVADVLRDEGMGTLLFDLLTREEDVLYENRFDIGLLTDRLIAATKWLKGELKGFTFGYFGASTGAAAALKAAAALGDEIKAVVSRGGRPDLAMEALPMVKAPVLLIVGGHDDVVITMNREALKHIKAEKELDIVSGATHLFEEPGKLEEAARLAADWFKKHL